MATNESLNTVDINGSVTLTTVGNETVAEFGVRVTVGNEVNTQWKVRGLAQSSNKAVWQVNSACEFMKSVLPPPNLLTMKSTDEFHRIYQVTNTFQRNYIAVEHQLADLKKKLATSKSNLALAVANGQASLVEQYQLEVSAYTSDIKTTTFQRKSILANMPIGSAFVAHNTYCLLTYQAKPRGRRLI